MVCWAWACFFLAWVVAIPAAGAAAGVAVIVTAAATVIAVAIVTGATVLIVTLIGGIVADKTLACLLAGQYILFFLLKHINLSLDLLNRNTSQPTPV